MKNILLNTSFIKPFKQLVFLSAMLSCSVTFSQFNLVPNPSFEENDSCPSGQYEITPNCKYWYDPISIMDTLPGIYYTYKNWGTATYFHRCNNTTVGVPQNSAGIQNARTGDAYAGIVLYSNSVSLNVDRAINYISVELGEKLIQGQKYYAEFFYSLAELYTNPGFFLDHLHFVELGMLFTDAPIKRNLETTHNQPTNVYRTPQVSQMMGPGIDTISWIKVSGTFTAKGGEKQLTIGSFKEQDTTSKSLYTFIFIDDVSVYAIDTIEPYPTFDIWVYPVPSNDRQIRFLRGDGQLLTGFIDLYDARGRKVFSQPTYDMDVVCDLNLAFLKAGVYLYSIREHNGTIFKTGKIVLL